MGSLKVLPVDSVKIDRAFVVGMAESLESTAIIRAIITLCRILDLKITGEGVETDDQVTILQSLGCDYAQGFLISRPLPAARLEKLMARGGPRTGPLENGARRKHPAFLLVLTSCLFSSARGACYDIVPESALKDFRLCRNSCNLHGGARIDHSIITARTRHCVRIFGLCTRPNPVLDQL